MFICTDYFVGKSVCFRKELSWISDFLKIKIKFGGLWWKKSVFFTDVHANADHSS